MTMPGENWVTVDTPRELLVQALPGPAHHAPTDGALATAAGAPPARPRLEARVVLARRHPGEELLHHPRGQRVALPKPRHRGQRRFSATRAPDSRTRHLHPSTTERQLRRRRTPVVMRALRLLPPLGPGQRHGLLAKQLVERGQPPGHEPTRAGAGACSTSRPASAPPGEPAPGRPHSSLAFARLSLFSSSWRLLGPGVGVLVLVDAILTPTREPSLLSSQVQQGPGHPPSRATFVVRLRGPASVRISLVSNLHRRAFS